MTLTAPARATRRVSITPARTSLWRRLDWLLLLAALALIGLGTLLVWSATLHRDDLTQGRDAAYAIKHVVNAGIGTALGLAVAATDHRWVRIWTPVVYLGAVLGLALIFAPGVGLEINGSLSWIDLGGVTIQPAEFAKLAVVVSMALIVAERAEGRRTGSSLRDLDVVLDTIGGDYGLRSLATLRRGGILVWLPGPLGPEVQARGRELGVRTRFTLVEPDRAGLLAITELVESGKLRVEIADVLPLADAARAHRLGESNRTTGKLVLTVRK